MDVTAFMKNRAINVDPQYLRALSPLQFQPTYYRRNLIDYVTLLAILVYSEAVVANQNIFKEIADLIFIIVEQLKRDS